jgi:hypothetical protein
MKRSIEEDIMHARENVALFGLETCDNVINICHALEDTKNIPGVYLECGVFRGSTFFTAIEFCKLRNIKRNFIGADTFGGFGTAPILKYDMPAYFAVLLKEKKISEKHYDLAYKRTSAFNDITHLKNEYFCDVSSVFEIAKRYDNVSFLQGQYEETLKNFSSDIAVLHLDCDLYWSYKTCLEKLCDKVYSRGAIVLDEYYSLKYPGARVAVDEFVYRKEKDLSMNKRMTGDFERWTIIKS